MLCSLHACPPKTQLIFINTFPYLSELRRTSDRSVVFSFHFCFPVIVDVLRDIAASSSYFTAVLMAKCCVRSSPPSSLCYVHRLLALICAFGVIFEFTNATTTIEATNFAEDVLFSSIDFVYYCKPIHQSDTKVACNK